MRVRQLLCLLLCVGLSAPTYARQSKSKNRTLPSDLDGKIAWIKAENTTDIEPKALLSGPKGYGYDWQPLANPTLDFCFLLTCSSDQKDEKQIFKWLRTQWNGPKCPLGQDGTPLKNHACRTTEGGKKSKALFRATLNAGARAYFLFYFLSPADQTVRLKLKLPKTPKSRVLVNFAAVDAKKVGRGVKVEFKKGINLVLVSYSDEDAKEYAFTAEVKGKDLQQCFHRDYLADKVEKK